MKLFFAPFSPYARKCRVVMLEKGLEAKIELVNVAPMENPPELLAANPLASVPALLLDNGGSLCDSPVMCEYLDGLSPTKPLIPVDQQKRFDVLGLAALADGIMDAAVSCVIESRKPDAKRTEEWIERKKVAINRTIQTIATMKLSDTALDIGIINTVVALNYVSFRLPSVEWRRNHTALAAWYDSWSNRPSFASTAPVA
jgi:glutathione S-transferase